MKIKWLVILCVTAFLAGMGNVWYQDYRNTHKTIEIETPTVDSKVRG